MTRQREDQCGCSSLEVRAEPELSVTQSVHQFVHRRPELREASVTRQECGRQNLYKCL